MPTTTYHQMHTPSSHHISSIMSSCSYHQMLTTGSHHIPVNFIMPTACSHLIGPIMITTCSYHHLHTCSHDIGFTMPKICSYHIIFNGIIFPSLNHVKIFYKFVFVFVYSFFGQIGAFFCLVSIERGRGQDKYFHR